MGSQGRRGGIALAVSLLVVASLATASQASARTAYVPTGFGNSVAYFPVQTPSPTVNSFTLSGAGSVAITPGGSTTYVGNNTGGVTPVPVATHVPGSSISVSGSVPELAISPDGSKVFASDANGTSVKVISTGTNAVTATVPLGADNSPDGIAVSPDGTKVFATIPFSTAPGPGNSGGKVLVIDTATNAVVGDPIDIGLLAGPRDVAFTPSGAKAYVSNDDGTVTVINATTKAVITTVSGLGSSPSALAITPDGSEVYVANAASNNVSVIDTSTDTVVGGPIAVGLQPNGVAITPDGSTAYVSNSNASLPGDPVIVSVINTEAKTAGAPVPVGTFPGPNPQAVAIVPDQGPSADFTDTPAQAGSPSTFDGSGSTDPDGTVARYDWDFGDGMLLLNGGPTPSHTYAAGGNYDVTLIVTDNEGCSATLIYTGQTALCNPNTVDPASVTAQVTIAAAPTPPTPTPNPAPQAGPTGQQAAALKKCKKKKSAMARKKCKAAAKKLPV